MTGVTDEILEEAIAWHLCLGEADAATWDAFTIWLEANPVHAEAYDSVVLADDGLDALSPDPAPVEQPALPDNVVPLRRAGVSRRTFFGFAAAAAVAAVVGVGTMRSSPDLYPVETAAGARQQVALADGSRIDLNGNTRLMLDRNNPRFARLERGEALFTVVHDDARPFEVEAGDTRMTDLGTVFNVVNDAGTLEVSVSEGAVRVDPGGQTIDLRPGMAFRETPGQGARVVNVAVNAVSGWREGQLVYAGLPTARVAADLSRSLGVQVTASPAVAGRPFTGVIRLDGGPAAAVERAGHLLGAPARRTGEGWTLTVGAGETP